MNIRKAEQKDINQLLGLLSEVLEIHAQIRPDIFMSGKVKYTKEELEVMIKDEKHLIYVIESSDTVFGYAFCEIKTPAFTNTMKQMRIFYIDDFCVGEKYRRQHIGEELFNFLKEEAKRLDCYEITLAHWEGNEAAKKFYEKMGLAPKMTTMEYILK